MENALHVLILLFFNRSVFLRNDFPKNIWKIKINTPEVSHFLAFNPKRIVDMHNAHHRINQKCLDLKMRGKGTNKKEAANS